MQNIFEIRGNLFDCPESSSLAHCVSSDLAMGRGIAVEFKDRFGKVEELINQNKKVGQVAVLGPLENGRFVYYLVTKERYWQKPTYETLLSSLECMKTHAIENHIKLISMPKIGCGLDRLIWNQVKQCLKKVFDGTDIVINVYFI